MVSRGLYWGLAAILSTGFTLASAKTDIPADGETARLLSNATDQRTEKFISLFTVVRFSNDQCSSSNNYSGTCLTSAECSYEGGTSSGSCASGFGVCCYFLLSTCGSSSTRNCTYITNPSSVSSSQTCMYTINKCSSSVCQIRVDYYSLAIAGPTTTTSVCDTDKFIVTGASTSAPTVCGQHNTNQHMYFDVASSSQIKLNFFLGSGTTVTRSWSIKVTQLPCHSLVTAPANCVQYYTSLSGTVKSFNYDTTTPANSQHLASQNYEICFRMEPNYCSICYTVCNAPLATSTDSFALSGLTGADAAMGEVNAACPFDYVLIPGGHNQGKSSDLTMYADRFCGGFFSAQNDGPSAENSVVCSSRKPFSFHFYTDSGSDATLKEEEEGADFESAMHVGFCLNYNQIPC